MNNQLIDLPRVLLEGYTRMSVLTVLAWEDPLVEVESPPNIPVSVWRAINYVDTEPDRLLAAGCCRCRAMQPPRSEVNNVIGSRVL